MTLRPGRNLIRIAGAAVLISLAAFYWAGIAWLLVPLIAAALAQCAYDAWWLRRHQSDLVVVRDVAPVLGRDVPFRVVLKCRLEGDSRIRGTLREVCPSDARPGWWAADFSLGAAARSQSFSQEFRIVRRGRYEFGPAWARITGPCGALEYQGEVAGRSTVKVFPEGLVAKDDLSQHTAAEIQILDRRSRSRRLNLGTEFESIAEYRAGDDSRRIDWRATARRQRLVVRRFQIEQHQEVLILIDSGRLMGADAGRGTKLDCAVDASLLLARVAMTNGDRCGIAVFDSQVRGFLSARSNLASFSALVDSVYDLQSRWEETDFAPMFALLQSKQRKRSLIVVLSDIIDEETSRRARTALVSLAQRHVVIFAALQTPLLLAQTRTPVGDLVDASRHAVAYRLLREREKALHALRRGNVHVADVEPKDLVIPLVNRYLDLRARNVV